LRITFCYKSFFIPCDNSMLILLVEEYLFGSYNIFLWSSAEDHTSLRLKLFNCSCIATTQTGLRSASSILKGSKEETNE
jgi:hypothetical protein